MGKKDMAAKAFFSRPEIIADLCNCIIFGGEQVISPEGVTPLPVEITGGGLAEEGREQPPSLMLVRDLHFHIEYDWEGKRNAFDLGLEFQSWGDANFVCRVEGYDGLSTAAKLLAMRRNRRLRRRGPALCPTLTLSFNFTGGPWRFACSLQERFKETDPRLLPFLNYRINLIDPFSLDEKIIRLMCPELKTVINCFRYSKDRKMLAKILASVPGGTLLREAVHFINVFFDMEIKIPERKERVIMCKAVREWKKELMEKGEKKGEKKGRMEGEDNLILNMLRRSSTPQQIHQMTGVPLERILTLAKAVPVTL